MLALVVGAPWGDKISAGDIANPETRRHDGVGLEGGIT
jgi:hypothetical protein